MRTRTTPIVPAKLWATLTPSRRRDMLTAGFRPGMAGADGEEDRVPKSRLDDELAKKHAEKERADAAEKRAQDAEKQLERRDRQNLPEIERLKAENTSLTRDIEQRDQAIAARDSQLADAAKARAADQQDRWIRDAAAKVTVKDGENEITGAFHDAGDAVARLAGQEFKTEDAARKAVEALAQDKRHLVAVDKGPAEPSRADQIRQVLNNGEPVDPNLKVTDVIPSEQFNAMTVEQHVAAQEADADRYARSMAATAQS